MPDRTSIVLARRHRRQDQQRSRQSRLRMGGIGTGIVLTIVLAVGAVLGALAYSDLTRDLPNVALLPALLNPPDGLLLHPTRVYDRTGQHLLHEFNGLYSEAANVQTPGGAAGPETQNMRRYIPLSTVSPQHLPDILAKATVTLAEPGFWRSGGYTLSGLTDPDAHPTIAQKLVSDLLLYGEPASLRRALRERILAAQLVSQYGRSQVLEWYLNSADYGNDAYGVDAAAELYFAVPATDLTAGQAAVLAATSQAPGLNPLASKELALQRARTGIDLMKSFGSISAAEAQSALGSLPRDFARPPSAVSSTSRVSSALFTSLVLRQLDGQFSEQRVRRGGLVITTSLDYDLQDKLAALIVGGGDAESASGIVLDPQSGQVLAAVGETDRGQETPNMMAHDPGTLMTPFVYLTAFTRGFSPGSLVWDIPGADAATAPTYHGPARMRIALANDYAAAADKIAAQMGSEAIARTEASFDLDASDATLLDLASAYGVFAADGVRYGLPGPTAVLRVDGIDHRTWLDLSNPQAQPVVTPALAYLMNNALSDESARWPSLGHPNDLEIGRPVGVKLGRSAGGSNTWGIAYTPARVAGVWMGTQPPSAGAAQVPIQHSLLSSVLQAAVQDTPATSWSIPPDVTTMQVCDPSGLLPTRDCPATVNEVFLSGNEPAQPDTLFHSYTVNRETGFLATVFTPPELVEDKVYMVIPPEAQDWAKSANIPSAPSSYDAIQAPPVDPNVHISTPAIFSEVHGSLQFRGTASGADFDHYRLLAGSGLNPQSWTVIADSSTRVEDGLLATWDTTGLSGLYAVELQVIRSDTRIDTAITQITIK